VPRADLGQRLRCAKSWQGPWCEFFQQTSAGFLDALSFYESRLDKEFSLVDCRSMLAMKSLGLTEVLSNDHHFSQEGFAVLFP
jgi:predicted nucleic acid-binding protein